MRSRRAALIVHLEEEIAVSPAALVGAAVTEIAVLRDELFGTKYG